MHPRKRDAGSPHEVPSRSRAPVSTAAARSGDGNSPRGTVAGVTFILLCTAWLLWHVLVAGRDVSLLDFTAAGGIAASAFCWRNGVRGLEFLVALAAGALAA
ncbi:MAG: hypothetical protein KC591_16685, partial [Gemmatimonadetes bacterium]|nr:hypothetical protein [Gemmatimonadota bacterium]